MERRLFLCSSCRCRISDLKNRTCAHPQHTCWDHKVVWMFFLSSIRFVCDKITFSSLTFQLFSVSGVNKTRLNSNKIVKEALKGRFFQSNHKQCVLPAEKNTRWCHPIFICVSSASWSAYIMGIRYKFWHAFCALWKFIVLWKIFTNLATQHLT